MNQLYKLTWLFASDSNAKDHNIGWIELNRINWIELNWIEFDAVFEFDLTLKLHFTGTYSKHHNMYNYLSTTSIPHLLKFG